MRCFDGDPVNRSLGQIKALNVEKLDLLNDEGVVMRSRYDALINRFLTEEAVFLVDSGATAFLPFWTFIVESDVISTLRTAGRGVYIHIPISGGDMLNDTLLGFQTLAETAAEKSLVVWINEYFGEIERDGKTFDQMQVFQDNREKVLTSIGIPQRSPDLYGSDIRHMRERKLTFEEAISVDPISTSWKNGGSIASAANCSNNWRKRHSREVAITGPRPTYAGENQCRQLLNFKNSSPSWTVNKQPHCLASIPRPCRNWRLREWCRVTGSETCGALEPLSWTSGSRPA